MKTYRIIISAVLAAASLLVSCEQEGKDVFTSTELGAPQHVFDVEAEPDEQYIAVYSNTEYDIAVVNGEDSWVEYPSKSSMDEGFTVYYDVNRSYPRSAMFVLSIGEQKDTVYLRQKGPEETYLTIETPSVVPVGSKSSDYSIKVNTNVENEKIKLDIIYDDVKNRDWIKSLAVNEESNLVFTVEANPDDLPRKAQIELSFIDGWNNKVSASCYVNQMNRQDEAGEEMTFEQVRAMAETEPGYKVTRDIVINGIVASDKASLNSVENPRNTITYIDYNACERCFILESEDGKYGFKIDATKPEFNIFKRYDKVGLNLNGATLIKHEATDKYPEYYDITGITTSSIVSNVSGTAADLPVKEMYMKDLKDSDIYTYVTLKDCELPVRKGSMTPINEGYSIATNANRSTKVALLLRDINGDDMYIMTNTTCPYRRMGQKLPYGSGTMSGIIVHELFSSYNYKDNDSDDEETYGYIGRYQIRHISKDDFKFNDDIKDSFSALLTEYRFITADYQKQVLPTYGTNGYLTHSFKYNASSSHGEGTTSIIGAEEFSYLGPIGNSVNYPFGNNPGNINGLGIIIDNNSSYPDGYDWGNAGQGDSYANINKSEAGKGKTPTACKAAWSVWYNWNTSKDRPYSYILNFSTLGISTTQLSMQFGMLNVLRDNGSKGTSSFGPRFWQVQWSTTGRDDYDNEWTTLVAEFMVPDTVNWSPATYFWQSPGFKTMNVKLPLEMLNLPNVYIRIRPTSNLVGTTTEFATLPPSNNTMEPSTAINYISIRYNK